MVLFAPLELFADTIPCFLVQESPTSSFGKLLLNKSTIVTLRDEGNEFAPRVFVLVIFNRYSIGKVQKLGGR